MRYRSHFLLLAVALSTTLGGPARSEVQQTADGAQRFLATVAANGNVTVHVAAPVPVVRTQFHDSGATVTETVELNEKYVQQAVKIEAVDGPCRTRAVSDGVDVGFRNVMESSGFGYRYDAKAEVKNLVADVDWSKATIKRGAWLHASTEYTKPVFFFPQERAVIAEIGGSALEYLSDDPEMLDRIEYAMKFLKASCDRTMDTGF